MNSDAAAIVRGPNRTTVAEPVLIAVLCLALAVVIQWHLGAFQAEFGWDESSHYVSGLLVHDFLLRGDWTHPVAYLRRYYASYPLVGIGHWGPLFYAVEAVWMLLFGVSRAAMLLLPAVIMAGVATVLYVSAAPRFGRALAAFAAFGLLAGPIAQNVTSSLLIDGWITLICLTASLVYVRYLRTRRPVFSLCFGLLAAAGLLTKGNAACLALLPPVVMLIGRDWRIMRSWSFWLPVPIVAGLAGPWYLVSYSHISPGFRYAWGWDYTSVAAPANAAMLAGACGPLVFVMACIGFVMTCRIPRAGSADPFMVTAAALAASVMVFQSVAPADIQDRYLLPAIPPMLLLAAFAIDRAASWLRGRRDLAIGAAAIVLFLSILPAARDLPRKYQFGLDEAARQVWHDRLPDNPSVLVVADGGAEDAAVAELAMYDPDRPSLFAIRGTRLLGGGGYNASQYLPRYDTPAAVMAAIDAYAIPLVLVRTQAAGNKYTHIDQVMAASRQWPERWSRLYRSDSNGVVVEVFQIGGNDTKQDDPAKLEALAAPRGLD
jgi:hypothetical protein